MIKIGIDLDGVVIDSETTFRVFEELFDIEKKQNKLVNREEPKFQGRYNWNLEEQLEFSNCFLEVSKLSPLMAGFKKVYELLKKLDVELIVITSRGLAPDGEFRQDMEDDAKRLFNENNIFLISIIGNKGIN